MEAILKLIGAADAVIQSYAGSPVVMYRKLKDLEEALKGAETWVENHKESYTAARMIEDLKKQTADEVGARIREKLADLEGKAIPGAVLIAEIKVPKMEVKGFDPHKGVSGTLEGFTVPQELKDHIAEVVREVQQAKADKLTDDQVKDHVEGSDCSKCIMREGCPMLDRYRELKGEKMKNEGNGSKTE